LSTLSGPIQAPITPVQSQSTSIQKGREDSFVLILDNDNDDFNNLGEDEDGLLEDKDLFKGEEIPNIKISTTCKGKEKVLPVI
jgi:hypothetical protein